MSEFIGSPLVVEAAQRAARDFSDTYANVQRALFDPIYAESLQPERKDSYVIRMISLTSELARHGLRPGLSPERAGTSLRLDYALACVEAHEYTWGTSIGINGLTAVPSGYELYFSRGLITLHPLDGPDTFTLGQIIGKIDLRNTSPELRRR